MNGAITTLFGYDAMNGAITTLFGYDVMNGAISTAFLLFNACYGAQMI